MFAVPMHPKGDHDAKQPTEELAMHGPLAKAETVVFVNPLAPGNANYVISWR